MDVLSITVTETGDKIEFLSGNDIRLNGDIVGKALITDDFYEFIPNEGNDLTIAMKQLIECIIVDQIEN